MRIPLFDVDWTLITGGSEHDRPHFAAYDEALRSVYHVPEASISEITPHGMIDTQILVELLGRHGVPEEQARARMPEALRAMATYFHAHEQEGRYEALPGVRPLLATLRERGVPLGVLTGNIEGIGWRKLELAGLRDAFCFGAFGDMAYTRPELIPIAAERARADCQMEAPPAELVLVGDSPLDVACARSGGVAIVAVASGVYSREDLRAAGADLVVGSLDEREAVLAFLGLAP
jgi:phosphoglycolate phosphatase